MSSVPRPRFSEQEPATKPIEHVPSSTLIRVARIEAHAERIVAILMADHDENTLADVFRDTSEIARIAGSILR